MIFDSLDYLHQKNLDPRLTPGLLFLKNITPDITTGRHDIDGASFAMVDEYETVDASTKRFEAHQNYIDIQMLLTGKESASWCVLDQLDESTPYDAKNDYGLLTADPVKSAVVNLTLTPGFVAVFYPSDGHRPGLISDHSMSVKKVVVKVPVK